MPVVRGKDAVMRFIANIPSEVQTKLLRGAAKAGATVIADEARHNVRSDIVRSAIKVTTRKEYAGRMLASVVVKGPGAYLAPWLEYGTDPHIIRVDESQRGGRSVRRINDLAKDAGGNHSLVIGGKFVGDTVFHPGARPHPFLRPALDLKDAEARVAAQTYMDARVKSYGIVGTADADDTE